MWEEGLGWGDELGGRRGKEGGGVIVEGGVWVGRGVSDKERG